MFCKVMNISTISLAEIEQDKMDNKFFTEESLKMEITVLNG